MSIEVKEHSSVEIGSSRSFGFVFATVFAIMGFAPLISDNPLRIWSLAVAGVFLVITLIAPQILKPLNIIWFKFGMFLGSIINPVVMLLIYCITIVPIGLILRLVGKDLLLLKFNSSEKSYWISRQPPGPKPESLEDQF